MPAAWWRRLKEAGLVLLGKHLLTPAGCAAIQALFGQEEQPKKGGATTGFTR